MRVLLSTIGSRGEVQPVAALALALRDLGQPVRVCAPPDFRAWLEGLGLDAVPIGPWLQRAEPVVGPGARSTPEQLRQLAAESVAAQFATVTEAARDCDTIVACGALQFAARSVAESLGARYVYASYCPITLPSVHHAPPSLGLLGDPLAQSTTDFRALWERDARRWNEHFGPLLNTHRAAAGLPAVADVRDHIFTDQPWLAADPLLGPWPADPELNVFQTGAWMLPASRPLAADLERFLTEGQAPVYFGFGSMRVPGGVAQTAVETARALGRRTIVSRGWAGLSLADAATDCMIVDEVEHAALFPRVAAVVHHGGAGTTTTAARAGVPQVVVPQMYDQHYWARRVEELGLGTAHTPGAPTVDSLTAALRHVLAPDVSDRARRAATTIRADGALVAARRLMTALDT